MTQSATCAAREISCSRSVYRAEQYDSDLGLYYLRARYYNPLTGRFLSRDPEDGKIKIPATMHKYLYVGGDPVNKIDPKGRMLVEEEEEDDEINIATEVGRRYVGEAANKSLYCLGFVVAASISDSTLTPDELMGLYALCMAGGS